MSATDDIDALAGISWPTYEPPPEDRQKIDRIHKFGMEVHCTLHSEILGYNDVHALMHDYCEDSGKDPQTEAKTLGFDSFREFLHSDYMKDLVICKNIGDHITYEAAPRKNLDHIRQEQWKSYQYMCQKRMKREGYCDSKRVRPQLLNVAKIDVGWPGIWDNATPNSADIQEKVDAECNASMPGQQQEDWSKNGNTREDSDNDPLGIKEFEDVGCPGKWYNATPNSADIQEKVDAKCNASMPGQQQEDWSKNGNTREDSDNDLLGIKEFMATVKKAKHDHLFLQGQQQEDWSKNGNTREDSDNDPLGIKEFMATEGELRVVENDAPVETESTGSSPDTTQYRAGRKSEEATHDLDNDEDPLGINGFLASKSNLDNDEDPLGINGFLASKSK
ncbi:hypothetical protein Ddc_09125 [Ditylenchus destructor]|nr:hypothetical protein Ddc_09125 [Ditylenchus destructor]